MRNIVYSISILILFSLPDRATAQLFPTPDLGPDQPPKWDYRFDAQYNSTVKPYLRWYRRGRNAVPKDEGAMPAPVRPSVITGCGCIGSGGIPIRPTRPSWFNPWKYLENDSLPKDSEVAPPAAPVVPYETGRLQSAPSQAVQKPAWVLKSKNGAETILYVAPPKAQAQHFIEVTVTTVGGQIVSVEKAKVVKPEPSNIASSQP